MLEINRLQQECKNKKKAHVLNYKAHVGYWRMTYRLAGISIAGQTGITTIHPLEAMLRNEEDPDDQPMVLINYWPIDKAHYDRAIAAKEAAAAREVEKRGY